MIRETNRDLKKTEERIKATRRKVTEAEEKEAERSKK